MFGGQNGSHTYNNVDVINLSSHTIRVEEPLLVPLSFPGRPSVSHEELNDRDIVLIASGSNGTYPFTATIFYDSGPSAPIQVRLEEGEHGSAVTTVLADGVLYTVMAGGFSYERGYLDDIRVFNHSSEAWVDVPMRLTTPRAYASATSTGPYLIVSGGYDGTQSRDDIDIYDLQGLKSVDVAVSLRDARHDHSSTVLGPHVYIGGGRNAADMSFASVEVLDSRDWTLVDSNLSLSTPGAFFQSSSSTSFGAFFVGGLSNNAWDFSNIIDMFICGNDVLPSYSLVFS